MDAAAVFCPVAAHARLACDGRASGGSERGILDVCAWGLTNERQTATLVRLCALGGAAVSVLAVLLYGLLRGGWRRWCCGARRTRR